MVFDSRIWVEEISKAVDISHGSVSTILHDRLANVQAYRLLGPTITKTAPCLSLSV